MRNNCIFTICAKNYIGLAQILEMSVNKHNKRTDFYIVVADELDGSILELNENVLIAKSILEIESGLWNNMSFKYNLTEFCTAIKPFSINYFFSKGYNKVLYMDPDTYLFNGLDYVFEKLDKFLFVTTPHITIPEYPYTGDLSDTSFLFNGINNFGFVGIRKSDKSLNIMNWWQDRLTKHCFGEMLWALCVDQKWMDFLPAFLNYDEFFCSDNLGLNFAPWNYYERKIIKEDSDYYVTSRNNLTENKDKLIFAHFAGYNYKEFATIGKVNNDARIRINNLNEYEDINVLLDEYVQQVWFNRDLFNKYLSLPYSYGIFDNGVKIEKFHRRLYNGLNTNFTYEKKPFTTSGKDSFFNLLLSKRLISKKIKKGSVDSFVPDNIDGFDKKLKFLYLALRIFYRIIGYKNYVLFLQFIRRLSLYDINTFLLGKQFENHKLR